MRIIDCHVHIRGEFDPGELVRQMDQGGVDRVILFPPCERVSLEKSRQRLLEYQPLTGYAPERISCLAFLNPAIEGIADLAAEAVEKMGYLGFKLMPDHWYPYEERLEPFWERLDALEARCLFHTGILYAFEDSSRFCHPVYLEKLLHYPKIHFAMAHVSWPWCEECIATMGRMKAGAARAEGGPRPWQSYIDITPGTPPHIRKQALANAIGFCGVERIMFGTDGKVPGAFPRPEYAKRDLALFDEIGLDEPAKQRIMAGTADELFPPRS